MRRSILAALFLALATPAFAASPDDGPHRFVSPRLDGVPVMLELSAGGQAWSAWSYAQSGEFDLALSSRGSDGRWSSPVFLGEGDGADQIDPALVADPNGVVYVAYAERGSRMIRIAAWTPGASAWHGVASLESTAGPASAPSLRIVGDRLIVAFRAGRSVEIRDLALVAATTTDGIDDGPDPFGGTGQSGGTGSPGAGSSRGWKPRR